MTDVTDEAEDSCSVIVPWLTETGWLRKADGFYRHGSDGLVFVLEPNCNYSWHLWAVRAGRSAFVREVWRRADLERLTRVLGG